MASDLFPTVSFSSQNPGYLTYQRMIFSRKSCAARRRWGIWLIVMYRRDIDGLRAFAVVPVVLYHAGVPAMSGGFVGVDVFFVISGYLITGLILDDLDRGRFSLARFYERRIRRILPALISMISACLVAGWFFLAPEDYRTLGRSAVAALLSFSNFFYFAESGYFDTPTAEKPLLHTWSLAIEEQFYLIFPVCLLVLSKFCPRWRRAAILALCAASFLLCLALTPKSPTAAFFMPQTRCWELLIGALLVVFRRPTPGRRWVIEVGTAAGLSVVFGCALTYSDKTSFPGWAAALPALGTAVTIYFAERSCIAGRLLAHPLPVFIGKFSYSLYLWHLPILAFGYYLALGALSPQQTAILLTATLVISLLSWRFIEQPARAPGAISRPALFRAVGVSGALIYATGLALIGFNGVPERIASEDMRNLALIPERDDDRQGCYVASRTPKLEKLCAIGTASEAAPSFVLWGDSHAEAMRPALDLAARRYGRNGVFAGERGCPPLVDVDRLDWTDCRSVNTAILDMISREPQIQTVILAARWGMWAERSPYKSEPGPAFDLWSGKTGEPVAPDNHLIFAAGLRRTVATLRAAGKEIWIVGPVPEVGFNVPRYFFLQSIGIGRGLDIRPNVEEFAERQKFALDTLTEVSDRYDANMVQPYSLLCDSQHCRIQQDGRALYFDDDHLSRFGAEKLNGLFDPVFAGLAADLRAMQPLPTLSQ